MKGIPRTKKQYNQGTYTGTTTEKRTLQGGNRRIRICYRRSTFPTTEGWEMETSHILVKDNDTSRTQLRNLRQRTLGNNGMSGEMEAILW